MNYGAESYIAKRTLYDGLDAAEDPQYQQMTNAYGEPVFHGDGTPMMERVPMAQRVAPGLKRRLEWWLWIRVVLLVIFPLCFASYVALQVYGPAGFGEWLRTYGLPWLAYTLVYSGGFIGACALIVIVYKLVKYAVTTPPWRKRL